MMGYGKDVDKEKETKPRILVVLPTLGQRIGYLRQTLVSIQAQAPVPFDVVIVGPVGNEALQRLTKEFGAWLIDDPGTLSGALNAAIACARPHHEFISWIGDDDLLEHSSFSIALAALAEHPEAVIAYGYCNYIDDEGKKILTSRAGNLAPWLLGWGPNLVPLPGILFRLAALRQAGEFDVNNKYSMDLDMLLRLRKQGKLYNTKQVLASFRWHATSTTVSNRSKVLRETEIVKRKYLPKPLSVVAPLWERPVRVATKIAAARVNNMANSRQ